MLMGRQRTPEAIGGLVAALGDEDEQLRWLAALSLQGIGGGTVIATLKAFIEQAAEKVLGKLLDFEQRRLARLTPSGWVHLEN
jgi:HEAT repeat protein